MNELLGWLESSALGEAIRGAGVWSYGVINAAHILGVATLFGSILVLDLRLIGVGRHRSVTDIGGAAVPVAATGLVLALTSGICLLATNGSEYGGNPFLPIKFAAIGVGALNLALLHRLRGWRRVRAGEPLDAAATTALRVGGAVSLASWLTAVVAGRMIGYW